MNNRTIKFRVYDLNTKDWIKCIGNGESYDGKVLSLVDIAEFIVWPEDYIIQQFTGMFDKNGREIFEGDIVKFQSNDDPADLQWELLEVMFISGGFVLFNNGYQHMLEYCSSYDKTKIDVEIVGNIFDNTELLN